jgi:branched-chain amino acid aminotransferase
MNQLLHNGTLLEADAFRLTLPNRGLAFGDGFFETLVYEAGRLRLAAEHFARMQQAAAALHLMLPPQLASQIKLEAALAELAQANGISTARLRLQLWRAGGGRYTSLTDAVEWLATAVPLVVDEAPVMRADFALNTYSIPSPLSFCKGPQAWLYVRAAHERQRRELDEIILCDAAGHVAEAGAAAIFWLKDGLLFTPALSSGCVAGVRRAQVLRAARAAGLECHEGLYKQEVLLAADAAFTANVASVRAVLAIGNTFFSQPNLAFLQRGH